MSEKVDPQVWYFNFKKAVAELIKERKQLGYRVTRVIVTEPIYNKMCDATESEPDNILGYMICIGDLSDDPNADQVIIDGQPIQ